jgi:hypothetical protein
MPMRAYRASRDAYKSSVGHVGTQIGHVGTHIGSNLAVWMIVCAVVTLGSAYLTGHPVGMPTSTWGHITALAGMLLGILVMVKAEHEGQP